jgi:hypothetical protein
MKKEVKCKILPMHNHHTKIVHGNGGIIPRNLSVARIGGYADPKSGLEAAARRTTET